METVRLLNVVLKISGDNLARCGNVLTEVRGEDAHSVQMIEQMQVGLGEVGFRVLVGEHVGWHQGAEDDFPRRRYAVHYSNFTPPPHSQREQRPGVRYNDIVFGFSGWLSGVVWRAAALMVKLLHLIAPARSVWGG